MVGTIMVVAINSSIVKKESAIVRSLFCYVKALLTG